MIPQIIHYCWFGRNPLPESAQKCIASWRKYLPDYEIWQWSEERLDDNLRSATRDACLSKNLNANKIADKVLGFDVNIIPYSKEAYEAKKYAFVSDYARFWILYHYGGLYFDTDVEVIKPMGDILERGPFMGVEIAPTKESSIQVNPGLGLGSMPKLQFLKLLLDKYATLRFRNPDGSLNQKTIVAHTTELLVEHGLKNTDDIQQVAGVWIYPADYFNPLDSLTGKLKLTENTRSIHWYMNSWSDSSKFRQWLSRMSHRIFGMWLHNLLNRE